MFVDRIGLTPAAEQREQAETTEERGGRFGDADDLNVIHIDPIICARISVPEESGVAGKATRHSGLSEGEALSGMPGVGGVVRSQKIINQGVRCTIIIGIIKA